MGLLRAFKLLVLVTAITVCVSTIGMAAEPAWIYGIHDSSGANQIEQSGKRGWIVVTVGIGHNPSDTSGGDFRSLSDRGHGVIVRLNNGYGIDGTLPYQANYQDFAARCANYVAATQGADIFIIGNETNLPREWPGNINGDANTGEPITVARYVDCYNRCYEAIKAKVPTAQVCPTPSGTWAPPYDGSVGLPNRGVEGFLTYWTNIITSIGASKIDGLALHVYTHGCSPALVTDNTKMGAPYQNIYYNFRVYLNYMNAIPSDMHSKPVYITECDENVECADAAPQPRHTWANVNNGWVKAIYSEINSWNSNSANQKIKCLTLFRWDDVAEGEWSYGISNRPNVITDWMEAMQNDYRNTNLTGTITGRVIDAYGDPISGASVKVIPGNYTAISDNNGYYTISNVPVGIFDVIASKNDFGTVTNSKLTVSNSQQTPCNFTLDPIIPIAGAKSIIHDNVLISGIVTAKFPVGGTQSRFYIEDANRTTGIGVDSTTPVSTGDLVQVLGIPTTVDKELVLSASNVVITSADNPVPKAIGLNNRGLGGSNAGLQLAVLDNSSTSAYASGSNNTGMLVRCWGKVKYIDPSGAYFYMSDGSGINDGSGAKGIRVACANLPTPAVDNYVTVTGISGTTTVDSKPVRLLKPLSIMDLSYAIGMNFLNNPGFENGSLSGWSTSGVVDGTVSGSWFGGITAHSGTYWQGNAAYGGTKTGYMYQRISAPAGNKYQAKAWSCIYRSGNQNDAVQCRVGIDPTGGTSSAGSNVVWSTTDTQPIADTWAWHQLATPIVTCTGGYVTVFLDIVQIDTRGWHIGCFDDAELKLIAQ